MNENPQSSASRIAPLAIGVVLGAVLGAGVALLLAPATGDETRRRITDAGRRWGGAARRRVDRALETASDLQQTASSALKTGREAFEEERNSHGPADGKSGR
jgi:gas vesicle protein